MGSRPMQWKCGKCNRTSYQQGEEGEGGIWVANTGRPVPTGPTRERRAKPSQLQYKCDVCGHIGWTCLRQAWREFHKLFPDKTIQPWNR